MSSEFTIIMLIFPLVWSNYERNINQVKVSEQPMFFLADVVITCFMLSNLHMIKFPWLRIVSGIFIFWISVAFLCKFSKVCCLVIKNAEGHFKVWLDYVQCKSLQPYSNISFFYYWTTFFYFIVIQSLQLQ